MARFIKKQKHEIGVAPDDLFFRGEQKVKEVELKIIDFDSNNLEEISITDIDDAVKYYTKDSVTWFNIDGLHNTQIVADIGTKFELESLILSDVMNTEARPKVQEYDNGIFISIKMLRQDSEDDEILVENLSIVFNKSILISFQERTGDVFEPVRDRIRKQKRRIVNSGPDYLAFALLDIVIDNYIYSISVLGQEVEELEDRLLTNPTQSVMEDIIFYKQELNFLRKNIKPAKEMILAFSKIESEFIKKSTHIHIKELMDNINHASELTDSYREILSDQLNIYHTTISTKLNDIIKFLTIFSVIFIPLTFIAGIYGTNFDFLPELHYKYSYFIMLGVMLVIAILMLFYFKKRKWF
ncbi:magnesium transporter [Saonia flava]|uniref:Magnesium transport protein CorA n=1 Tax=Saonia flava TaxID=523696 RepID=A0A846R5N1_9FLAO|nr:magnesium/cobalt transporter CorA [Saonia flava]NJB72684.1 magnesium transporter [Saonia flava]